MIEVIEVQTERDLNDFIKIPFSLYSKTSLYIPPLTREIKKQLSQQNPFFLHATARYFVAKRDGKLAGRIAAIVNNRHLEFHHDKAGFYGFFESLNDHAVASSLLDKAAESLRNEGMTMMRGPMNFSTNEECGFLLDGFDSPPMLLMPYNPDYYNTLMEEHGMKKVKDLYAYILNIPEQLPEKIHRVARIGERGGIKVRRINKNTFESDMMIFKDVYNSAWARNWGFIPLTDDELKYLANSLKDIARPDLTLIAEKDGDPVGFMGLIPDFNFVLRKMWGKLTPISILKALYYSRRIKDLRMLLLGVKAEYRNKGIDALLFREGYKGVRNGRYERVEFSWILEDNIPVQRLVEMIGGSLYKKYRIYEKEL